MRTRKSKTRKIFLSRAFANESAKLISVLVVLGDCVPVHHVPPSFDVVGPAVLVIEIISVFPNIHSEDRRVSVHERAVLVRGGYNFKFSTFVFNQPRPTAAEATGPSCGELLFKCIETSERGFDIIGEFAFRFAASVRAHDRPEEGMIGMPAAIISHHRANIFWDSTQVADQILH